MTVNKFEWQMEHYRSSMNALIFEKENMNPNLLEQKKNKARQQAKHIFSIEGQVSFQEMTQQLINRICDVKPGRKLMKIFTQTLQGQIILVEGNKAQYLPNKNTITISKSETLAYNALRNHEIVISVRPLEILLAHEMIHAMHNCVQKKTYSSNCNTRKDIIKNMTNLEEQATIVGFNPRSFRQKYDIIKYDVLSENAFLFAFNLLPRVDHLSHNMGSNRLDLDNKKVLKDYYDWIEREFHSIIELPEEKKTDISYILNFIKINPLAITSISDDLKIDDFLLQVLQVDIEIIIEHFPELKKNKKFLKKALKSHPFACALVSSELLKDKKFAIYVLRNTPQAAKNGVFGRINNELKNDPDIQALIPNLNFD